MKKILLSTIIIVFISIQTKAQNKKGAYVALIAGYNASDGGANTDYFNLFNSSSDVNNYSQEKIKFSFAKGFTTGISVGYMFNKNIGADIAVQYLAGSKTEYSQKYVGSGNSLNGYVSATMVQIKPTNSICYNV